MLPPVESAILAAYPKFQGLYRDLCTNKLNEDGSSKLDAKALKDRQGFENELYDGLLLNLQLDLRKVRMDATKRTIVLSSLREIAYKSDALPDELQELVAIAAASLASQIANEDKEIVLDELEIFKENAGQIGQALSNQLLHEAEQLVRIINPENNPSIQNLPDSIRRLHDQIATSRGQLSESRLALASQISNLHKLYRQIIELSIKVLEQTIHGSISRNTKAKVDYLGLVAEGMNKKLSIQHDQLVQQIYSSEVQNMLASKSSEIEIESRALRRKVREAEEQLDRYQRAIGMKGLAKEYAEVLEEIEKTKEEIERLEESG